ncbi:MAG: hypothetical protein VB857_07945, partial [Pirellulaceae bacterium]
IVANGRNCWLAGKWAASRLSDPGKIPKMIESDEEPEFFAESCPVAGSNRYKLDRSSLILAGLGENNGLTACASVAYST